MKKSFCRLLFLFLIFFGISLGKGFAQDIPTGKNGISLRLKSLSESKGSYKKLYTVVGGKEYPIDTLSMSLGLARLEGYGEEAGVPAWYLDPEGRFLYYSVLTGCGYENDGMAIFRTDLYGKRIEPVIGSCDNLTMESLADGGKNYLLIREGNSGAGLRDFWIFDLDTHQPIVHAEGLLEKSTVAGKYQYCKGPEEEKTACAEISMQTLLQRQRPLRLLPRFPLIARTVKDDVPMRVPYNASCGIDPSDKIEKIPQKGSVVVILDTCKDRGVYEVYFRGTHGTVSKNQLSGFQIK